MAQPLHTIKELQRVPHQGTQLATIGVNLQHGTALRIEPDSSARDDHCKRGGELPLGHNEGIVAVLGTTTVNVGGNCNGSKCHSFEHMFGGGTADIVLYVCCVGVCVTSLYRCSLSAG